jgi:hypothetical protein
MGIHLYFKLIFDNHNKILFMIFQSLPGGYKSGNLLTLGRNNIVLSRSTRDTGNGLDVNAEVSMFIIHTKYGN